MFLGIVSIASPDAQIQDFKLINTDTINSFPTNFLIVKKPKEILESMTTNGELITIESYYFGYKPCVFSRELFILTELKVIKQARKLPIIL